MKQRFLDTTELNKVSSTFELIKNLDKLYRLEQAGRLETYEEAPMLLWQTSNDLYFWYKHFIEDIEKEIPKRRAIDRERAWGLEDSMAQDYLEVLDEAEGRLPLYYQYLEELKNPPALTKSKNRDTVIAIDNVINSVHIDLPLFYHLWDSVWMETGCKELQFGEDKETQRILQYLESRHEQLQRVSTETIEGRPSHAKPKKKKPPLIKTKKPYPQEAMRRSALETVDEGRVWINALDDKLHTSPEILDKRREMESRYPEVVDYLYIHGPDATDSFISSIFNQFIIKGDLSPAQKKAVQNIIERYSFRDPEMLKFLSKHSEVDKFYESLLNTYGQFGGLTENQFLALKKSMENYEKAKFVDLPKEGIKVKIKAPVVRIDFKFVPTDEGEKARFVVEVEQKDVTYRVNVNEGTKLWRDVVRETPEGDFCKYVTGDEITIEGKVVYAKGTLVVLTYAKVTTAKRAQRSLEEV